MILAFLVDDIGLPRLCLPPPLFTFPHTTILAPIPSLRTGECFCWRPARPQPASTPWTRTSWQSPKRLTVPVPCPPPPPHSNAVTASGSSSALTRIVTRGRGYRRCKPRNHRTKYLTILCNIYISRRYLDGSPKIQNYWPVPPLIILLSCDIYTFVVICSLCSMMLQNCIMVLYLLICCMINIDSWR